MAKKYVTTENAPLSQFGVLESILLWQRRCEDALYSLLTLGARRPVRHLASVAMARVISKGDGISIYSRASSLQGFLSDGRRNEPQKVAGAAQCLGELYRHFGRRITSGLLETTIIATKLFKFNEEFVRQEALYMLQNALEGSGGNAAASAYTEAFRLIMRFAVGDKSFLVRIAAARCLKAFAIIGGPGLGVGELDSSASYCVKVDAFHCQVFLVGLVLSVSYFSLKLTHLAGAYSRPLRILFLLSVMHLLKHWVRCLLLE
ncbi:hypothetical protein C1H46_042482 [Malus baccata]|uniref:Clathrin/coatomer adaptor adaptin-like N-terminal domain-containing protein n=1 Tax=Malus baccata TaxID=106549 RepID=A0A540KCP7_MALBA|nr:hypothetical protein C1H46_042482 [Malus baccata]